MNQQPLQDLALDITQLLFSFRRSHQSDQTLKEHQCELCFQPHLARIQAFINSAAPIHLVLPAFPVKSPNVNKVLGRLPDKGELLALRFLNSLCEQIKTMYAPGASLTICSDGHVFADLLTITDEDVTAYHEELRQMIIREKLSCLNLYSLEHVYPKINYPKKRSLLDRDFVLSLDTLRQSVRTSTREMQMVNGITRFILDDINHESDSIHQGFSKTRLQKKARDIAYQMVRRSHGWGEAIAHYFPNAIRLSIHPQPCHYEKLGIFLLSTKDNWLTPWHSVVVKQMDGYELMKKSTALRMPGARIVYEYGRPFYIAVM